MMIFCSTLLIVLFFAGGALFSASYLWPIVVIGFILVHFWIVLRGYRLQDNKRDDHAANESQS